MPRRLYLEDFQAVLFDVDGTLVNSLGMIIPGLGDTIEKYAGARPPDAEIKQLIGMPIRAQLERYLAAPPEEAELQEMTDFAIDRYKVYESAETMFDAAVEFMRECKRRGMKIALVTSKNSREIKDFLERFPLADAVDAAVCASDVPNPKPAPDAAWKALELLGLTPEQAVFVGDSIYDMQCAKGANVATVAVSYGSAAPQDLALEEPDLLFKSPEELLAWAHQPKTQDNASQESNTHRFRFDNDDSRNAGAA